MTQDCIDLLEYIRQHVAFKELQSIVPRPSVKPFRLTNDVYQATTQWVHDSGRIAQHEAWLAMLTGPQPSEPKEN